jgi:phage antirepressor YoqD-like protein
MPPFTRWSLRKLADYLAYYHGPRRVRIGRERLRELLHQHDVTFQRTKTWKETNDPNAEAKFARIEEVTTASCAATNQLATPWPRSSRSAERARTAPRST